MSTLSNNLKLNDKLVSTIKGAEISHDVELFDIIDFNYFYSLRPARRQMLFENAILAKACFDVKDDKSYRNLPNLVLQEIKQRFDIDLNETYGQHVSELHLSSIQHVISTLNEIPYIDFGVSDELSDGIECAQRKNYRLDDKLENSPIVQLRYHLFNTNYHLEMMRILFKRKGLSKAYKRLMSQLNTRKCLMNRHKVMFAQLYYFADLLGYDISSDVIAFDKSTDSQLYDQVDDDFTYAALFLSMIGTPHTKLKRVMTLKRKDK